VWGPPLTKCIPNPSGEPTWMGGTTCPVRKGGGGLTYLGIHVALLGCKAIFERLSEEGRLYGAASAPNICRGGGPFMLGLTNSTPSGQHCLLRSALPFGVHILRSLTPKALFVTGRVRSKLATVPPVRSVFFKRS
jgi:hypothetical protein